MFGSSDGWDSQRHGAWYFDVVREARWAALAEIFDYEITFEDLPQLFARSAAGPAPRKPFVRYRT